jgi:hypothetical protein
MNIPTFTHQKFVEDDGTLSAPVHTMFDVFFQQAQDNLSNDGLVVPSLPTSTINYIASPSNQNSKPNGTLWYDSETNQLKVKINGLVKVVTTV